MSMGHPAQYHFFKHTARRLQEDGYEVKMVIKTKDVLEQLLKEDGWDYVNVQEKMRKNNKLSIFIASLKRSWAVIKIASKFILLAFLFGYKCFGKINNKVSFDVLKTKSMVE